MAEPQLEPIYQPPRRFGRKSIAAWLVLLLVVFGAIAALLIWVAHRLGQVAT